MTRTLSAFDGPNADFKNIQGVSGNGVNELGTYNSGQGIAGVLTIENGAMRAFLTDSQLPTDGASSWRTEIYLTPDILGEVWYTWEFNLPGQYWSDYEGGALTIGQLHDKPDQGETPQREPNFLLQTMHRTLYVVWPHATLPDESPQFDRIAVLNLEWDRWYSVCVHIRWAKDATGFREVFIDHSPVYRQWNVPTAYDDVEQPYLKLGIYNTSGGDLQEKLAYFRNLRRWTGNDGYQVVMGELPSLPSQLQEL